MSQPEITMEQHFRISFDRLSQELRGILETHNRDIQARLTKIEKQIDERPDKDTVNLLNKNIQDDVIRQGEDITKLDAVIGKKMNTETMWKLMGLVLTVGTGFGSLIGFVIHILMR